MFNGFSEPTENWSKLPNQLIDALPEIETIGEMKVILYILRHTWGYHETEKRITLDEFSEGRKRKNGERLDGGTGLTIPTIQDGLKRAENHGFITVETDTSDLARIKKFYSLNLRIEKVLQSGYKSFSIGIQDSCSRSEKETLERNPSKDILMDSKNESINQQALDLGEIETLEADSPMDNILFEKINTERVAAGRRRMSAKFQTRAQKQQWRDIVGKAERKHNGKHEEELKRIIDSALQKGLTDRARIIAYVGGAFKGMNDKGEQLQAWRAGQGG